MSARLRACSILGLSMAANACLSTHPWASEVPDNERLGVAATQRDELERRRSAALEGGDTAALIEYMAYLWQFDHEHRDWLARIEIGKSPRLPASLSDFDREVYTDEVLATWTAMRPAALPSTSERVPLLRAEFLAAALRGGCRDTQQALAPLLIVSAEGESASLQYESAIMHSECGHEDDAWAGACAAAGRLLAGMPEPTYDDLDGDMWPDRSLRVHFAELCPGGLDAEQQEIVNAFHRGAEPWFAEHHPEEHRAWREEMARQAAVRRQAEAEARAIAAESAAASASSGGAGAPASGGMVSVRLYNACSETVKLFFGDNPKFGSGTSSQLSSNTSTSYSMREGDMIWIMIDGEPAASYSASPGNASIQITRSCGGFAPR